MHELLSALWATNVVCRAAQVLPCHTYDKQVQCFYTSTMTTAQRDALAGSWLAERATGNSSITTTTATSAAAAITAATADATAAAEPAGIEQQQGPGSGDGSTSDTSEHAAPEQRSDVLETWMLLEYCERGSLERALARGKLKRPGTNEPDMVRLLHAAGERQPG